MDIIPSDLPPTHGGEEAAARPAKPQRANVPASGPLLWSTPQAAASSSTTIVFQAASIAQKYNCQLTRLDFRQEEG